MMLTKQALIDVVVEVNDLDSQYGPEAALAMNESIVDAVLNKAIELTQSPRTVEELTRVRDGVQ